MKNFQFIPVLDLKDGHAVKAFKGDRDQYRALISPLCATSDPVSVAKALLDISGSNILYVADIDAIEGRGDHGNIIGSLAEHFPETGIWADTGLSSEEKLSSAISGRMATPVVGSESLTSLDLFSPRLSHFSDRYVLSLDFGAQGFLGPKELLHCPGIWPDRVIVMTLEKVGSGEGPQFGLIEQIVNEACERLVFAAGGLRHVADAEALLERGVAGVLSANAFHNGMLTKEEIAAFCMRCGDS